MIPMAMSAVFIALGYFFGIAKHLQEKGLFWPFAFVFILMSLPLGNGHI